MTQLTKREQIALEMFSLRGRLLLDESVNEIIEFSISAADRFLKHLAETEPKEHELPKASNLGNHGAKYKDVAIGDLILIMDKDDYSNLISIGAIFMPLWKIVMPVPSVCKFPIYLERTADGDFYREKPDAKGAIYGFLHGEFKKLNSGFVGFTEEKPKQPDLPEAIPMNADEIVHWIVQNVGLSYEHRMMIKNHINALVKYEVNKAKR